MKIVNENENPIEQLKNILYGSCIKLEGEFYIVTNELKDEIIILVNLSNGELTQRSNDIQAEIIEAEVMIR